MVGGIYSAIFHLPPTVNFTLFKPVEIWEKL
jgi:hypothetical protein